VKAEKSLNLAPSLYRLELSRDGSKIYVLNEMESKLVAVDVGTFEKGKELELGGGERCLSQNSEGTILIAAGKRRITVVSVPKWARQSTFTIEENILDACAVNSDTVVVSTTNSTYLEVSIKKEAVVGMIRSMGGSRMILSGDGRRIHTGEGTLFLPDRATGVREMTVTSHPNTAFGEFSVSPDYRMMLTGTGNVYRLGRSFAADLASLGRTDNHQSAAWALAAHRVYLFNSLGFMKEYDIETWELKKSWYLGWQVQQAYSNDQGTLLTLYGLQLQNETEGQTPGARDLVQLKIPR
jgi:hypothetical protein